MVAATITEDRSTSLEIVLPSGARVVGLSMDQLRELLGLAS